MRKNRKRFFGFVVLIIFAGSFVPAQEENPVKMYTVDGKRHGQSYFPYFDYDQTHPKKEGEMDFCHYHKYGEVVDFLKKWAEEYPFLVDLYSVGKSYEGRDIWQITITNKAKGKDSNKPAMFLEGNRHAGEVTAAESALYFTWYVLTNYGKDLEITNLLDTKALYVRVKNNPDGSLLYLNTAQTLRSTVRPHDGDRDGLLDEDPLEDLDNDGFCYQIREFVGEKKGNYIINPDDKTGRLMKSVDEGEGNYKLYSEGLDNDLDGKFNEDGIGGLDLHRNYPENWRPEPGMELTGRGWTQRGAGAYPLSETETRSVVLFLLQHPNVSIGQSMDTTVSMLLRPPSTSRSEESMFKDDLRLYRYFDEQGLKITGYRGAGDVYWDYANLRRDEDEEKKGRPLFGHSPDFGYFYYGSIWYGDELWCGGRVKDYDEDGKVTDLEIMKWNDEALEGSGFKNWEKFNHPQLGEVEIGGFNPKFFRQNPPPEYLEEWVKKEAMFNLFLAKSLPQVKIVSVETRPVEGENNTFEITGVFTNEGFLPTSLEMARRIKIVRPDWAEIKLPEKGMELVASDVKVELGHIRFRERKEARWKVKITEGKSATAEISIHSTRGGVQKKTIEIKE
ncbi:M14 family metallopeptidase [Acidobacteriota bacterium]